VDAELISIFMVTKEALALRLLIMEINPEIVKEPTVIMTDSA